jgi:hypothetical protein
LFEQCASDVLRRGLTEMPSHPEKAISARRGKA